MRRGARSNIPLHPFQRGTSRGPSSTRLDYEARLRLCQGRTSLDYEVIGRISYESLQ